MIYMFEGKTGRKIIYILFQMLAGLYSLYAIIFGILVYAFPKQPSEDFKKSIHTDNFYGNETMESVDRVGLVEKPQMGADVRLYMHTNVKETLEISYYVTHWGESTEKFFASIMDAANRGVKVRMILDGMYHGLKHEAKGILYAFINHPNIELRFYEKFNLLKPWIWNSRLHEKYIIADKQYMLLGGRNIGDKYFAPDSYKGQISNDRDVFVLRTEDPKESARISVIDEVEEYFNDLWESAYVKAPRKTKLKDSEIAKGRDAEEHLLKLYADMRPDYDQVLVKADLYKDTLPTHKVSFIHNQMKSGPKEPWVGYQIFELLRQAKERVVMQSPYTVPDKMLMDMVADVSSNIDDFTMLTNSMYSSPNFPAFAGYLAKKKQLVDSGLKIYEYQGFHSLHAKSFIVDDDLSIVGSYNLDPRSAYIDTENMLVIHSKAFTDDLNEAITEYEDNSLVVGKDYNYIPHDGVQENEVDGFKKFLFAILKPLTYLFNYLL